MKCPNCGKEMVCGIVESDREIMWRKEEKSSLTESHRDCLFQVKRVQKDAKNAVLLF